jgi:hypothetical protein
MNPAYLATIILLLVHLCLFAPNSLAQSERGHKGAIDKKTMLSIFDAGKDDPDKGWVDGYVIDGTDIIGILKHNALPIKIRNSVIKHGLDFSSVPKIRDIPNIMNELFIQSSKIEAINKVYDNKPTIRSININSEESRGAVFNKIVSFSYSQFDQAVDFTTSIFKDEAHFYEATFNNETSYRDAIFAGDAGFATAHFIGKLSFVGATFSTIANFTKAIFSSDTSFWLVNFQDLSAFIESNFNGAVDFSDVTFAGDTDFGGCKFTGESSFRKTKFNKKADFICAVFNSITDFRDTVINAFNYNSNLHTRTIGGRLDFRNSQISKAHFENLNFEKFIDFSTATIRTALFKDVTFNSSVNFIGTQFIDKVSFERINVQGNSNFSLARFPDISDSNARVFMLSHAHFDRMTLTWNQLPDSALWVHLPNEKIKSGMEITSKTTHGIEDERVETLQPLSEVFRQLETNFRNSNQLEDANEAYFYRKQAELREASTKSPDKKILAQLEWLSWGIWTGYGVRIWRVILMSVAVDLIFALLYFVGKPQRKYEEGGQRDFTFKQRFLEFPRKYLTHSRKSWTSNQKLIRFANSVRLSSVILFKFGYRDTTISGKMAGIDYKYIIWTEWILGFVLLGFLAVTLSNTLPILHKLVSAVF